MSHDRGARQADLYRLLQVDPEADPEIIGAAYRKLAQRYHPDVTGDPAAADRMAAINAAWEVLRDPARRAAYDRERRFGATPPAARGTSPAAGARTDGSGRVPGDGVPPSGAASTADGERWRAGSVSGTGGTPDDWVGPPPGRGDGSVLTFGRYRGWSLGEIARRDAGYLEWLERAPVGRQYQREIADILRRMGRRR